jgi:hypothetical protein
MQALDEACAIQVDLAHSHPPGLRKLHLGYM